MKNILTLLFAVSLTLTAFGQNADQKKTEPKMTEQKPTDQKLNEQKIKALENKVNSLEDRLSKLERLFFQNLSAQSATDTVNKTHKEKARERMRQDQVKYTSEQLREAEELYQKGSDKMGSPVSLDHFKELIAKYPEMNRSGCAALYLALADTGTKENSLKEVISKYSDCYYLDGVNVGAYARWQLAKFYFDNKQANKGEEMFSFLRKKYPDAIDHKGNRLLYQQPDK